MHGIPAASVLGVDWDRARRIDPLLASELECLAGGLNSVSQTDDEFLRLCKLLVFFGETGCAKALLISNSDEGSAVARYARDTFPDAEAAYTVSVHEFGRQFGVELRLARTSRLFSQIFECGRLVDLEESNPVKDLLKNEGCEVHITFESNGNIVADVYLFNRLTGSTYSIPLVFARGSWRQDSFSQKKDQW